MHAQMRTPTHTHTRTHTHTHAHAPTHDICTHEYKHAPSTHTRMHTDEHEAEGWQTRKEGREGQGRWRRSQRRWYSPCHGRSLFGSGLSGPDTGLLGLTAAMLRRMGKIHQTVFMQWNCTIQLNLQQKLKRQEVMCTSQVGQCRVLESSRPSSGACNP